MADRKKYFYSYHEGLTGDFIPFYKDGVFHLFHIAWKDWGHATTKDFVTFEDGPVAILHGEENEQDADVFTGSVIEKDGIYHSFYCGHCNANQGKKDKDVEVMLHATSKDLYHWEKDKDFALPMDKKYYAGHGWRDGFVFYDEDAKLYKMLITSATKEKSRNKWGCTALAVSEDLKTWKIEKPLYAPSMYDSHECPDMFKMGDKWYMVFSTYTRWWETHYRIADRPEGPFRTPAKDDLFDGRAFYAAKTVSDGKRRFIIGWTAIKGDGKDEVKYGWGGNLTAHEIIQRPDGTLGVKIVDEVEKSFTKKLVVKPGKALGTGSRRTVKDGIVAKAEHSFYTFALSETGDNCLIKARIKIKKGTGAAGIVFRADYKNYEKWCALKIEPEKSRIYFDRANKYFHDQFYDETRPIRPTKDGIYDVRIVTYGSMCVMYVNDVALSVRNYDYDSGKVGFFVEEGSAKLLDIEVSTSGIL